MIEHQETIYKSQLMAQFHVSLPHWVLLRHEDVRNGGHPDFSATGHGVTSWGEVKHATPTFASKGLQEKTLKDLAREGRARYVIYWEDDEAGSRLTFVLHPTLFLYARYGVSKRTLLDVDILIKKLKRFDVYCAGFNHEFVVDHFRRLHGE